MLLSAHQAFRCSLGVDDDELAQNMIIERVPMDHEQIGVLATLDVAYPFAWVNTGTLPWIAGSIASRRSLQERPSLLAA